MRARTRAAVAIGAVFLATAADKPAPHLSGAWAFQTEPYREGECVLTGSMTLRALSADGKTYAGRITARERCADYEDVFAEQSCIATLTPEGLVIRSTVEKVRPETMLGSYAADSFVLPEVSAERMRGELRSAARAGAEFVRPVAAIS